MAHFLKCTSTRALAALAIATLGAGALPAAAQENHAFLEGVRKHVTLTTTVPDNGDQNPYAIVVAPVAAGKILKDDVLIDNFNDLSNLQGLGTTIVDYNPTTKQTTLFASVPRHLPACPGGVGMTTAMTMLKTGWVIVGSTPSNDGTTKTKGDGCLLVLSPTGELVATWTGPDINSPWGNIATVDNGSTASLFISMAGFDVPGPEVHDPATGQSIIINKSTVLRLDLTIADGKPPVVAKRTVVANGFGQRSDKDVFLIGPTGLAMGAGDVLYVSDALENRIVAIPDATTRTTSAGTGKEVTRDGLLSRPLAMVMTPNGHLLVCNSKNGKVVEIDPVASKQIAAQWIDTDQAQSPPGSGDLFGIALTADGKGFYYVEDDMNTVVEAR
jgi:hypothetical protein